VLAASLAEGLLTTTLHTSAPSMDAPRAAFAAARAAGRMYVMGGSMEYEPLASVRSLAPYEVVGKDANGNDKEAVWRVESPMPFPRRFFAAASWRAAEGGEEAVFVLGGAGRFDFNNR